MKKEVFGIMLMFLWINMLALGFYIQPVKAGAETVYVDDDDTAGPWDGTKDHPYQNITAALQHASAWSSIYVYNGTYYESVVVNKTLSLVGENREATIIDGCGIGNVTEVTADNVAITGFTIRGSGQEWPNSGLALIGVRNCNVYGDDITSNFDAIRLSGSSGNNSISANRITNNLGGIALYYSSNNSMHENSITANNGFGIFLHYSSNNSIRENNIVNNRWGIELDFYSDYNSISGNDIASNNGDGIGLDHSMNNAIFRNNIAANNECGIRISGTSTCNCISGNDVTNNSDGMRLSGSSSNNTIFHNNFVGNQRHAAIYNSYGNQWDDGYPSGGNFWSDYQEKCSNASEIDNSGIWNTPYTIDSGNSDCYPLMNKYVIPEKGFLAAWFDYFEAFLVLFLLICLTYLVIKRKGRRRRDKVAESPFKEFQPQYTPPFALVLWRP
jgi:parallel beta-helix repeat protein